MCMQQHALAPAHVLSRTFCWQGGLLKASVTSPFLTENTCAQHHGTCVHGSCAWMLCYDCCICQSRLSAARQVCEPTRSSNRAAPARRQRGRRRPPFASCSRPAAAPACVIAGLLTGTATSALPASCLHARTARQPGADALVCSRSMRCSSSSMALVRLSASSECWFHALHQLPGADRRRSSSHCAAPAESCCCGQRPVHGRCGARLE